MFVPEATAPGLVSYTLDCNEPNNTGLLQLSFSEPVNASTFVLTKLVLQDAAHSSLQVRLTPSGVDHQGSTFITAVSSQNGLQMSVWVTIIDMNSMKQTGLVSLSAYLTIDATLVRDMVGNGLTPIVDGSGMRVAE